MKKRGDKIYMKEKKNGEWKKDIECRIRKRRKRMRMATEVEDGYETGKTGEGELRTGKRAGMKGEERRIREERKNENRSKQTDGEEAK